MIRRYEGSNSGIVRRHRPAGNGGSQAPGVAKALVGAGSMLIDWQASNRKNQKEQLDPPHLRARDLRGQARRMGQVLGIHTSAQACKI